MLPAAWGREDHLDAVPSYVVDQRPMGREGCPENDHRSFRVDQNVVAAVSHPNSALAQVRIEGMLDSKVVV